MHSKSRLNDSHAKGMNWMNWMNVNMNTTLYIRTGLNKYNTYVLIWLDNEYTKYFINIFVHFNKFFISFYQSLHLEIDQNENIVYVQNKYFLVQKWINF